MRELHRVSDGPLLVGRATGGRGQVDAGGEEEDEGQDEEE